MRKQVLDYWWLIALSISAGVAGQATIKLGTVRTQEIDAGIVGLVTMILHSPLILFGRNIPLAALIPLTLVWFGIGEFQKIMFLFIACVPFITADSAAPIGSRSNGGAASPPPPTQDGGPMRFGSGPWPRRCGPSHE